ncbi:Uncharacterised protein [Escherichia coli]|nr:hypothetical protein A1SK_03285 [Escherichia coli KTE56]OYK50911.1 hypothetical protein CI714_20435 [Shigella sonnei]STI20871.1 Uncharacterised protein [Escherichia coli]STI44172.1 Uncharacterised protein [Escherichia coli]VVY45229.1 Uncharacterised protein [Escherichia coli]
MDITLNLKMKKDKALEFYEKLYFSEIENKDKIHTRAQAEFGLVVITATILTYLAKNTSYESHPRLACLVFLCTAISFGLVLVSSILLKQVIWGNEFKYCPAPKALHDYHIDLISYEVKYKKYCDDNGLTYDESYNPDNKLWEFIHQEIRECASWNSNINEERSSKLFESTKYLVWSWIPIIAAVVIFLLADLDAASPRKNNAPNYLIIPIENVRRT